jgi:short-subunit dehydrogenase involved in D-alanine esterification of teichoic acids
VLIQAVIATGASSGIGLATVKTLLQQGASVLGVDRSAAPSIEHERFRFLRQDITEEHAPKTIVSECMNTFDGRVDALLNIAGVLGNWTSAETFEDSEWERTIAVNLTAPARLMREAVQVMKKQKSGSIVNVSSIAGTSGAVSGLCYTTAKHALVCSCHFPRHYALVFAKEIVRLGPPRIRRGYSGMRVFVAMRSVQAVSDKGLKIWFELTNKLLTRCCHRHDVWQCGQIGFRCRNIPENFVSILADKHILVIF